MFREPQVGRLPGARRFPRKAMARDEPTASGWSSAGPRMRARPSPARASVPNPRAPSAGEVRLSSEARFLEFVSRITRFLNHNEFARAWRGFFEPSYEDLFSLPENKARELVDGQLIATPRPFPGMPGRPLSWAAASQVPSGRVR